MQVRVVGEGLQRRLELAGRLAGLAPLEPRPRRQQPRLEVAGVDAQRRLELDQRLLQPAVLQQESAQPAAQVGVARVLGHRPLDLGDGAGEVAAVVELEGVVHVGGARRRRAVAQQVHHALPVGGGPLRGPRRHQPVGQLDAQGQRLVQRPDRGLAVVALGLADGQQQQGLGVARVLAQRLLELGDRLGHAPGALEDARPVVAQVGEGRVLLQRPGELLLGAGVLAGVEEGQAEVGAGLGRVAQRQAVVGVAGVTHLGQRRLEGGRGLLVLAAVEVDHAAVVVAVVAPLEEVREHGAGSLSRPGRPRGRGGTRRRRVRRGPGHAAD